MLDMITPGLSISGAIGFNTYFKSYSNKTREYARYGVSRDDSGEVIYNMFGQNTSLEGDESSSYQWRNYAVQGSLNYSRVFGRHSVDALAQMNYDDYTMSGSSLPYKNVGVAGRASWSLDEKYIAEFSFGYYGNENFPRGSRFGFFPAGAVGWIVSKENFMRDSDVFDFLKVRLSYGMVGNSNIGGKRFMYNQYYDWGGNYYFGTSNSGTGLYYESSLANPGVTWEKEKKFNVGLEATLWGKLSMSFDYFRNKRYDILTQPFSDVPDWLGISLPDLNNGKVDNNGFELTVGWKETSSALKWFVNGSLWYARNKVVYNSEAPKLYDYQLGTGRRIGQPFMLEAIGFFSNQADIDSSPVQVFTTVRPGDIKYKDQNGDNRIDENDSFPIGYTSIPEMTLGLNVGAEYKGFDLNAMFHGAFNRSVYWDGRPFQAFQNNGKISEVALGRWTPQTAGSATYPRLSTNGNLNNYRYSSFWQKNGNFLKLRSLELGYTIEAGLISRTGIEKMRVYLSGTNLFSIDHMKGYADPETILGYPAIRTYSIGFNMQF
jgi:TonB-linked SusC/RagA family outer membrane protein